MDKAAHGHDFIAKVDKHDSQKDYKEREPVEMFFWVLKNPQNKCDRNKKDIDIGG